MDNQKLVREIAVACERAYRRGFQHGVGSTATAEQAYAFRFDTPTDDCPPPPGAGSPLPLKLEDRLRCETVGFELLQKLLS